MSKEQGSLSINSENIFPVIKKWLYSDHDIFVRELISNGCDAITKLKKLALVGEFTEPDGNSWKILVRSNPEEKTLTFIDNGIGMTADEVKKYINEIAFSGATDFLTKYKDKASEEQIIGHFGLGFYSAFMVAHKVTIDSLSYTEEAVPVHWESEEGLDFTMEDGDRTERGTEITLYLNEDSYEFSNEYRVKEILNKYCSFMPIPIFYEDETKKAEEEKTVDAEVNADGKAEEKEEKKEDPKPINDIAPLFTKHPNECTEEDYKKFYRDTFHDYKEPLFWIHLNMDYPFNLKGILYFPKINTEYDSLEGTIKLYNSQVFIADNIKEVIPEFLMLLKGVIDCPDIPLNVSRSALQNDGFVKKISDYITKKVADKLSGMYKVERESYEKFWDDICPFIKFGCLKDEKFLEKMQDYIIYKNLSGKYVTLPEYLEGMYPKTEGEKQETDENTDETVKNEDSTNVEKKTVYYVSDEKQQGQYISMFKESGLDAVIMTHNIDNPFITQLEQRNENVRFQRIDAELNDTMKEEVSGDELDKIREALTDMFRKNLGKDKLEVSVEKLKNANIASMLTLSEESRRMQEMMKMYGMGGMGMPGMEGSETLVLNANNNLVQFIFEHPKTKSAPIICAQLYDLAVLSQRPLRPEEMTKFVERTNQIMTLLTK